MLPKNDLIPALLPHRSAHIKTKTSRPDFAFLLSCLDVLNVKFCLNALICLCPGSKAFDEIGQLLKLDGNFSIIYTTYLTAHLLALQCLTGIMATGGSYSLYFSLDTY